MTYLPSPGVFSRTNVYAQAGWVVAECACGWYHRFRPAHAIPASRIWDYALDHSSAHGTALGAASTTGDLGSPPKSCSNSSSCCLDGGET